MMELLLTHAPSIGLLFFFLIFLGIAVWAIRPSNRERLQSYAQIPLKEDSNDQD